MMDKLKLSSVVNKMRDIHREYSRPLSNYYSNYSNAVDDPVFECITGDNTIIFCINEVGVYRAFYYSGEEKELVSLLSYLPKGTIMDIIDRNRIPDCKWLNGTGFVPYTTYIRFGHTLPKYEEQIEIMKSNPLDVFYNEEYGEFANSSDVYDIQKLISNNFDVKSDHLFTDSQMLDLISEKSVFVEKDNGEIYCVLIARVIGKKIYMNLIVNEGSADVSYSMEKKAVLNAIRQYGVNYEYAWIDERNKKALKRCKVSEDNLFNHIYEKETG